MADQERQKLSPREMVRAHAYPFLAAVSTISLVIIAASLVPIAKQAEYMNQCISQHRATPYGKIGANWLSVRMCHAGQ